MPRICVKNPIRAKRLFRFAISRITEDEWDEIFGLILKHSDDVEAIDNIEWEIDEHHELIRVSDDLKEAARIQSRIDLSKGVEDILSKHLEFYSEE